MDERLLGPRGSDADRAGGIDVHHLLHCIFEGDIPELLTELLKDLAARGSGDIFHVGDDPVEHLVDALDGKGFSCVGHRHRKLPSDDRGKADREGRDFFRGFERVVIDDGLGGFEAERHPFEDDIDLGGAFGRDGFDLQKVASTEGLFQLAGLAHDGLLDLLIGEPEDAVSGSGLPTDLEEESLIRPCGGEEGKKEEEEEREA